MLDIKTAQKVFDKYNLGKVNSIENQATGVTGTVFDVNNKFIVKIQNDLTDEFRSERNALVCDILKEHTIKAPLLIALDVSKEIIKEKYILTTKLKGEALKYIWKNFSKADQKKIFFDYGKLMAQFHQIKMEKFGDPVDSNNQHDKWYDCIISRYKNNYEYVKKNRILSENILYMINDFFVNNNELLQVNTNPVLVHNDFQTKNIMYYNENLNGIFDFDECIGGHYEMDFLKTCLPFKAEKVWLDEIFKGYKTLGSISQDFPKRIKLYKLNFSLKVLKFTHVNNLKANFYQKKFIWAIDKILTEDWKFLDRLQDL